MPASILLIEDNPANLELMTYLLTAFGHTVRLAGDGEEGLRCSREQPPDLVLCDLRMPRMDGYEMARRFKAEPALAAIPLVAVTASAMVGDRDKVFAAGFDGYLSKPIDSQTFVSQADAFLPLHLRSRKPEGYRPEN